MSKNHETLPEAPLISHLTELRQRLIYSFAFFAVCVGGCFYFADIIFIFLLEPLKYALGENLKVTYWAPHEAFFAYMNLALYAGLIIALPFFLIQIWRFIAPGLYNNEKKAFLPFLLMTPVMFTIGLAFAFYIVMPTALSFFAGFQTAQDIGGTQIIQETRVSEYLQFCLSFLLIFGLAFELPIGLVLAGKAGLISADTLRKTRPYAIMGISISSAFFTPPDIISMFSLAAPLYIMYEISILLIASFKNNHQKGENCASKNVRKCRSVISGVERKHIPIVRLEGIIGGKGYGKKGLTLDTIKGGLSEAFKFDKKSKEVILIINSPGGSPSQSSLIYKYINHLKEKHEKEVIVFVEDVAASGGYYIACAGNSIFADDHSVTGSIGVVSGGFGFVDAIKKLGVERRVHTSGENKSMLDPFSPEKDEDINHLKSIQTEIHSVFKDVVSKARGDKLVNPQENEIFTGKFWAANKAKELGLIDDIITLEEVLNERYGEDYRIFNIEMDKRSFFEKKFGVFASDLVSAVTSTIDQKISSQNLSKLFLKL